MDIIKLYQDFGIEYKTEGHKHCHPGWVHISCPLCSTENSTPGYHLGIRLSGGIYQCWRCGKHSPVEVISKLLNVNFFEAKNICLQYIGTSVGVSQVYEIKVNAKEFKLPPVLSDLTKKQRNYLIERRYDPDKLIREWGIKGTGPSSFLDKINYQHRIVIPIYWEGQMVSFQSRDTTGLSELKYLTCSTEREIVHHKHIIFGKEKAWGSTGIAVEGVFDVFRFGVNSFATLGIEYMRQQVREICNQFDRIPVCFDGNELQARKKADELVAELRFRGKDSFRVDIQGDPAEMDQNEADYLVKQLIK